jgi:hypothetical protein
LSFLSASFLYAMAAAAIPLVIHLIQKQRYPERPFTTLRFFDKTIKNNTIQRRIIDKLLLLLRVAALIAIVIGLARPHWKTPLGEQRSSFVLVIDNSPSMSRERDGQTLFDLAKRAGDSILAELGPSDRAEIIYTAVSRQPRMSDRRELTNELDLRQGQPAALWLAGEKEPELALAELTPDTAKIQAALRKSTASTRAALCGFESAAPAQFSSDLGRLRESLRGEKISALPGDVHSALISAARLLHTSQDGDRKIILISDLQKSEWQGSLEELAGISVLAIPLEAPPSLGTNLGLEACSVPARDADFGQSIVGTATVRNYGTQVSETSTLSVVCGDRGRPVEIKLPPIQPGSAMLTSFPIQVMSGDRNMLCHAHIGSATDPFAYDDNWYFQLGVRFPVATLLVNGVPSENVAARQTFFLMNALVPRAGGGQNNAADARECELADLKDKRLAEFGVVVLCGVPALDADMREKVRQFVSDGKSVLIFPAAASLPEDYNAWGFLPAQITEKKSQSFAYIKSVDEKAPAMAGIADRLGSAVHSLSASTRVVLEPSPQSKILARFSDGTPALVEGSVGKGRVILAATSAHNSDSDWPLRPAFVILVRHLVKYLGADSTPSTLLPERTIGEAAATTIPRELAAGTPAAFRLVSASTGSYESLPWIRTPRALILPASATEGHYLMTVQPGSEEGVVRAPKVGCSIVPVSVNHSTHESNLTALSTDELPKLFPASTELAVRPYSKDISSIISELRSGRDLWRWILIAAVALLCVESLVAWRWHSEASS